LRGRILISCGSTDWPLPIHTFLDATLSLIAGLETGTKLSKVPTVSTLHFQTLPPSHFSLLQQFVGPIIVDLLKWIKNVCCDGPGKGTARSQQFEGENWDM
jgi:hypothetical protein